MKDFFKSFGYAIQGVLTAVREQRNLKVQLFISVVVIGIGFYFDITSGEWCIILLTIGMVIGMEMINTSVESLVDLVTLERKPQVGKIKDIAAGAVLIVSAVAVVVGILVFKKYFLF